jgi:uncharacterized protein YggL (DUF469 family)
MQRTGRMPNKRLRAKYRLAEFREYGFEVSWTTPAHVDEATADALWERFIAEVERLGMSCGGGWTVDRPTGAGRWRHYVTLAPDVVRRLAADNDTRRTSTGQRRSRLLAWIANQPEVTDLSAGELTDAWYDPSFD